MAASSTISSSGSAHSAHQSDWLIRGLTILILLLPISVTFFYVRAFAVEIPMWDDWDFIVPQMSHLAAGQFQLSDINGQVNDGLVLGPEAAILLLARPTSFQILTGVYLSYLFVSGCLLVLFLFFRLLRLPGRWSILWFLPVSLLFMGWRHSESLLHTANIVQTMSILFSLAALYGCTQAYRVRIFFAVAVLCAWIGSFSFAVGLIVWPLGATYFALAGAGKEPPGRAIRYVAGWSMFAAVCAVCFFFDHTSLLVPWPTGISFVLANLEAATKYLLIYLGSPFSNSPPQASMAGIAVLLILLPSVFFAFAKASRTEGLLPVLLLPAFTGCAALAVVQSRLGLGIGQAIAPRYVIHSILGPIGAYFCLLALSRAVKPCRYLLAALLALFVIGIFNSYSSGLADGRNDWSKSAACAKVLKDFHRQDPKALSCAYPDGASIIGRTLILEKYRLSLFRQ
jgi:hypothetical protein